jgi:hypothetical protein
MPDDRRDWSSRIKAVERQYNTARFAAERLCAELRHDPSIETQSPAPLYVNETLRTLEVTYVVRMFAEFESGLRSFWRSARPNRRPKIEHLIQRVASNRKVSNDLIDGAHAARKYRNSIVHDNEHDEDVTAIPIADARRKMVLFFERLPFRW